MRTSQTARGAAIAACVLLTFGFVPISAQAAAGAHDLGALTRHVTVQRAHLNADGTSDVVDKRTITLSVSQTRDLRGREQITVSWSGAHPTGGLVADVNSGDAALEEYPFVLMECRGVDSASAAQRIAPQTCWTQTAQERYQEDDNTAFPSWRLDRFATVGQRAAVVNEPSSFPPHCADDGAPAEYYLPFRAEDGKVYPGGAGACAVAAPEAANVSGGGLPSNTTYGITAPDGSGSAQFAVFTADENASLGCSDTVPCSLVAVPIEGISCDAYGLAHSGLAVPTADGVAADDAACRASGKYAAGQVADSTRPDLAVSGALWWAASNWRNRITIPLQFAPPSSICSVVGNGVGVSLYGSVPLAEASAQWAPAFCTNPKLFSFTHVQTSDPAARDLLQTGNIEAALGSESPAGGFSRPTVQAPIAVTGFAISYAVDDVHGNRYAHLRLDARLLAKLLTESYPADADVRAQYTALSHNPLNITQDPEFQALNPGIPALSNEAAAELIDISSEADLTYALTSYINADPEARAWLDGDPDPWGMVVNPHYRRIQLPVSEWPLLDTFQFATTNGNNLCYDHSPAPWLNLVANPTALLANVALDVQFGLSNVDLQCNASGTDDIAGLRLLTLGRQQPGRRFLLGVTSLGEAGRYQLRTAALQTSNTNPDRYGQFQSGRGRRFVAPSDASMRAAAAALVPDTRAGSWAIPYRKFATSASAGYPGTMVIYADIPTVGIPVADARRYATWLRFVIGTGQQPGLGNGQLPPGYLPVTQANGLDALADYTLRAATAVQRQNATVPTLSALPPATSSSGTSAPAVAPVVAPPVTTSSSTPPVDASSTPPAATASARAAASTTHIDSARSNLASFALPALFGLTLVAALLAPAGRYTQLVRSGATSLAAIRRRRR